ncbi:hypothetical protein [Fluviicola sp.]|uniref:hypothetical protein n=1 Tax=Fluviicola sp. TaxID=1917219 RepID=UPI002617049D|nr:hypothetical protein [Fluviicola sp.]
MNLSGRIKKLRAILIPLAVIFLIDLFSVRTVYQNCTCPELFLIDPVETLLLKWKYRNEAAVRTNEIYSEKDLSPDGPRPAFITMTYFGYYLDPKCEDVDCKIQYPQFRILFSIPTVGLFILEVVLFFSLFFFRKNRS